jgi:hypothetical protein
LEDNKTNATLVTQVDAGPQSYKRRIGRDKLLLMTLSAETSSYTASMLDLPTGTSRLWRPALDFSIWAQVLPVTYIDVNGKVFERSNTHVGPRLYVSGDRSHVCWIDPGQDWIVCDLHSEAVSRRPRARSRAGSHTRLHARTTRVHAPGAVKGRPYGWQRIRHSRSRFVLATVNRSVT